MSQSPLLFHMKPRTRSSNNDCPEPVLGDDLENLVRYQ